MHFSAPIAVAFCCIAPALAADRETKGVDLTLVCEHPVIAAGQTFTVGVKIHHHPRFHTYWLNPGVAGVATTLEWQLPLGFTAGPIQWPAPERSFMAIHPVHGYERDVVLLVDITAPKDLPTGSSFDLKAKAGWMACADGCFPGEKDLAVTVSSGTATKADAALAETFSKARAALPQPLSGWSATVTTAPDAAEIRLLLTPAQTGAGKLEGLYFFSSDGQISSDPVQTVTSTADGGYEIVAQRSPYGPKGQTKLPGVLIATTSFSVGGPSFASVEPVYTLAASKNATATEPAATAPKPACCEED